nr:precorrin-3B C(17)-methyltransferase [Corynebacterium lactis]
MTSDTSTASQVPSALGAAAGHLYGVGLGPGDAGLITLRGGELIRTADVIAYHSGTHGRSTARAIAADLIDSRDVAPIEEQLRYPVTVGKPDDYGEQMASFYAEAAATLSEHLSHGRSVAVLSLGDPMLYSSYQHLHHALASHFPATIVPGVASINAASAEIARPLAEATEILSVVPATASPERIRAAVAASDCVVFMKLGRHVEAVREALREAGMLDRAWVVERATMEGAKSYPLADANPDTVPYFAVAVVSSAVYGSASSLSHAADEAVATSLSRATASAGATGADSHDAQAGASAEQPLGEVVVVGLGPGAERWTTPEVTEELARATDIVGYSTYVNRVPERAGQRRHLSDNRVEAERATMALDIARRGGRVAVVSSGDPGVFAMAAAVLEVANDPVWKDIPVRVVPGMTAAQAVASRVGAPLGHDFAMLSLSDRLKPWDVVEKRLRAVAGADMAFAVYNPASKSRRWQIRELRALMLEYRDPKTPVIVARAVGSDQENVTVTTLAEFDPDMVDMRTMVIMGSSSTVAYRAGGTTRVYTARHYGEGGTSGTGELLA